MKLPGLCKVAGHVDRLQRSLFSCHLLGSRIAATISYILDLLLQCMCTIHSSPSLGPSVSRLPFPNKVQGFFHTILECN